MLRNLLFAGVLAALAFVSAPAQVTLIDPHLNKAGLVLEYNRAICTLHRGMALHWSNPDRYLRAFDKMSRSGTTGQPLTNEYSSVRSQLAQHFAMFPETPRIWDEQMPETFPGQRRIGSALGSLESARDWLLVADQFGQHAQPATAHPEP
jgi:hypothetical protein